MRETFSWYDLRYLPTIQFMQNTDLINETQMNYEVMFETKVWLFVRMFTHLNVL